ncbi:MAG TPA: hypothetical protein VL494_13445 [Steroidobacteraceae bacterium]|jgi:hypothetical protein|nr:hypothetical protein [Steroidobacteraceae bacterium]
MPARNPWEQQKRREKVAALTRHITELVSLLGLTPESDGWMIADLVRGWGDKEWRSAAINIGKKPNGNKPLVGFETRLQVIQHFIEKARKSA